MISKELLESLLIFKVLVLFFDLTWSWLCRSISVFLSWWSWRNNVIEVHMVYKFTMLINYSHLSHVVSIVNWIMNRTKNIQSLSLRNDIVIIFSLFFIEFNLFEIFFEISSVDLLSIFGPTLCNHMGFSIFS